MFNKLKSHKGITGIDLTISIIIIMMFVSIIATLSINVSSSLASKRRLEITTNCITEIMEKLDGMNYENVELIEDFEIVSPTSTYPGNENGLRQNVKEILSNEEKNYDILKVELKTEKHEPENYTPEIEGDVAPDLIKKVTVKITYNKDETPLEVIRLKTRYNVNLEND